MDQPVLNFDVPISGNTRMARHASWTGARAAADTWTVRQAAYLRLLRRGARTDHQAAAALRCGLSSINSIRNGLEKHGFEIVPDGFDLVRLPGLRATRRTRWRLQL